VPNLSLSGASQPTFEVTEPAPSRTASGAEPALAIPVLAGGDGIEAGPGAAELEEDLGLDVLAALEGLGARGAAGELHRLPVPGRQVYAVGVGAGTADDLRRAGAVLGRVVTDDELCSSVSAVGDDAGLTAFVAGVVLGSFSFTLRTTDVPARVRTVTLCCSGPDDEAAGVLDRARAVAVASWQARWLATVPSNIKDPAWLADQAVALAEEQQLATDVWDEERLAADGFGGILAVGRGSASPPRLVRLDYEPSTGAARGGRRTPRVVLVGKGITFDTGGLSIKPGEAMVNMKRDMTGAAVVTGVMSALRAVGCPVRVTGLLACAENAIGADAMRPGDVLRHYGGTTTEVTNTDAEGRLVMADALAYADAELDPAVLVDVATLTGAMKVALGLRTGGFFATHDGLADSVLTASRASGERVWRMPLVDEYDALLDSSVADLDNAPGHAGAITAALFLRNFTGGRPWVHFDIASVGDAPEDRDEWTKGPTGFGVRLLLHWLGSANPLEGLSR
jgi:leucyl aminopeptidase